MKKLLIPFCFITLSCQNHTNSDSVNNDLFLTDTVQIKDTTTVKEVQQPTGGLKLKPIVLPPRDSIKAIQYKDSAITLLIRNGNLWDAKYMADEAIYNNPEDADSYYIRGNIYQKLVRYDNALEDFQKALEIKPNHIDAIKKIAVISSKTGDEGLACYYLWRACNMGDPEACEGAEKFCNNNR